MNRRIALMAFAGLCLTSGGPGSAQTQDGLAAIRAEKKIMVGLEYGRPPWAFKDDKLQGNGSDLETAQLLANDLGVRLEIVELTGPNRIPFLLSRKVDIVLSAFSITPERLKVVEFSVPYASAIQYVAAPKALDVKSLADLADKRVGVTRATTGDTELTKQAGRSVQIVRFDDESTNMTALTSGQVDIVVQEPATVAAVARQNPAKQIEPKFILTQFAVGIGLRKNEPALKTWLDDWVRMNLSSGKLNAIFKKHHGSDLPPDIIAGKS